MLLNNKKCKNLAPCLPKPLSSGDSIEKENRACRKACPIRIDAGRGSVISYPSAAVAAVTSAALPAPSAWLQGVPSCRSFS